MKRSRFPEEQNFDVMTEAERGAMTGDLARWLAVSEAMLNSWKAKNGRLDEVSWEATGLLEDTNSGLKRLPQTLCWIMQALDPLSHMRNNRAEALIVTT